MKGIPIYFGEIAIQERYIDEAMLQECLELQKLYRKPIPIGEILKEKSYLRDEDLTRILKIQQAYKTKLESEYFANIALKMGFLTSQQIRELRNKFSEESEIGIGSLSELAVQQELMTEPMVEEILNSQEYKYFLKLKAQGKSIISNYELIGNIIKLKKSIIYKAIQVELSRLVAVKTLLPECASREYIQSFFEEAKATARFNHPNLVRIYDTGYESGTYYYAMELVEGDNLAQQLSDEGRLQVPEALRVIRQIAQALEHIHSYQYIHGTVNPRNIVIREDKVAKLFDLSASCKLGRVNQETRLSKMPQYMAPEQFKLGEKLDVRTDIYSLGATFYRMLTGKAPIGGKTVEDIRQNVLEQEPKPIQEHDFTIPEALAKIVHRMLRKDPEKRYREIKTVLFALKKILL